MRHMRYLHSCDDANPKKRVIETINETDNDIARSCARKYTRAAILMVRQQHTPVQFV